MADKITLQDSPQGDKQQVRGRLSKETNFRDGSKPPPQQRGWLQVCLCEVCFTTKIFLSPCASTRGKAALSASSAAFPSIQVAPPSLDKLQNFSCRSSFLFIYMREYFHPLRI